MTDPVDPQLTSDPNENPFAVPTQERVVSTLSNHERSVRWLSWAWPAAVACHLPVTLFFGWMATNGPPGKLGMFSGIGFVYWVGRQLCKRTPWLMRRLVVGAFITALSQFYPIAQMFIGATALEISRTIFGDSRELSSLLVAGSATILTGIGLILPSLVVGLFVLAVLGDWEAA